MRKILLLFSVIPLVVLGIAGALFVLQSLTVQANLRTLHATTCLGGWENVHLATGVPETKTAGVTFASENSARLSAGTIAQIYCAFAHEIADDSTPQRILVRFLLGIEYPNVVSEDIVPDTSIDESVPAPKPPVEHIENTVIEGATGAGNNEIPAEGAGAATDGWPQGSAPTEVGEGMIIEVTQEAPPPQVLQEAASAEAAQEAALPQVLQESASAEFLQEAASVEVLQEVTQENVAVEAVQQEETAQEANVGQENVKDATAEDEIAPPVPTDAQVPSQETFIAPPTPPIPDKHGPVEMLYTLDGVTWKSFGFVPKNLPSDMYFEIPIEEASDWKDISRIQISVRGVPTLDEILPTVYLDAVWLEIEHQKLQEEGELLAEDEAVGSLPDFKEYPLEGVHASTSEKVAVVVKREETYELWVYNIESGAARRISTDVAAHAPIGIKDGVFFWLSKEGTAVYAYDPSKNMRYSRPVPPFDPARGERARVHFPGVSWDVMFDNHGFYFFSEETGEVFSDENADARKVFGARHNLYLLLSDERMSELGFMVESEPDADAQSPNQP